ncbi:MAG: hypothetical protein U9Q16_00265 [Patescibacteria group bacterium]|nr:hypothetical protein [Patescibacteria group bacterium]
MKKNSFAFLAHRVEPWNWLLNFRMFDYLHKNPKIHRERWLLPVYIFASIVGLFGKGFEKVDEFRFNGMRGQTILLRNYKWHFLFPWLRQKIKQRILLAVLSAQKENQVIGLGALTKAEWLTKGGRWIVDSLGDKLKANLVHGDTLTAAACLKQTSLLIKKYKINSSVFVTGATSKIGRAIVLVLALNKIQVRMYTKSRDRALTIIKEAGRFSKYIKISYSIDDGKDCRLWLIGKSKPSKRILLRKMPKNAIGVNFSVPNPFGEWNERPRKDLLVVEGGLLSYDSQKTNLHFTMRLRSGLTYACHAATAVHCHKGWQHHEVDKIDLKMLGIAWNASEEIGFFLPPLPILVQKESIAPEVVRKKSLAGRLADVPASTIF